MADPGSDEWAEAYLNPRPYVAANLEAALKLVPDTGDWHGQLRLWAAHFKGDAKPNVSAEQMAPRAVELAKALIQSEVPDVP